MTATDRLVGVDEVAEMFSIKESTLYSWRARGVGPRSFRVGGRVVYRLSQVESWLEAQESGDTARGEFA